MISAPFTIALWMFVPWYDCTPVQLHPVDDCTLKLLHFDVYAPLKFCTMGYLPPKIFAPYTIALWMFVPWDNRTLEQMLPKDDCTLRLLHFVIYAPYKFCTLGHLHPRIPAPFTIALQWQLHPRMPAPFTITLQWQLHPEICASKIHY